MSTEQNPSPTPEEPTQPPAETPAGSPAADAAVDHDPLPEDEELTPELMEDECLRGDAMLRWAALLLAILLSWTCITESTVLVQIRSGEYMLSHGVLPPRTDPFSASAADRPWVNLGWLSDIVLGLAHKGGFWLVTLVGVACTLCGFRALNRFSLSQVSTWWASICLVVAALAAFPVLQPGQGSVTLLGLSLLGLLLLGQQQRSITGLTWKLPLLMFLWSNSDPRAFLGLLLLLGWAIGAALRPQPKIDSGESTTPVENPWTLCGLGIFAALIHPWHIHVLLAPYNKLFVVAPELKAYAETSDMGFHWTIYGLLDQAFWNQLDLFGYFAVVLLGLALATQILNLSRLHFGWALGWLLVNLTCLWSGELLACAAVVNAMVAILNGQDWFRSTFSQDYAIDTMSVIFGRAGRAVTVLAMFFAAYATINGMLMGPDGRRVGMGLDPRWQDRSDGLAELLDDVYGEGVFPLRLDQGDLLIWLGRKPYVDNRLSLYASGKRNLLQAHRDIRIALRAERPQLLGSGKPEVWKSGLSEFETFSVIPRLWGRTPDYSTFFDLLLNQWELCGISAASAVFLPTDIKNPELQAFVEEHSLGGFVNSGIRHPDKRTVIAQTPTWPTPPGTYDRWLIQKRPRTNNAIQLAAHYNALRAGLSEQMPLPQVLGLIQLAIRHARLGLEESPGNAIGYRILRESYAALGQLEQVLAQARGVQVGSDLRSTQALAAAYHSYQASQKLEDLYQLAFLQLNTQQLDLALKSLEEFQSRHGSLTLRPLSDPGGLQQQTDNETLVEDLRKHISEVRKQLEELAANNAPPQQLVSVAVGSRCPGLALELIERDKTQVAQNPELSLLYAGLQLSSGRSEDAWESLEALERYFPNDDIRPQQLSMFQSWCRQTAQANLAALDLPRAIKLLKRSAAAQSRSALRSLLETPTLANAAPSQLDLNVPLSVALTLGLQTQYQPMLEQRQLEIAALELEQGYPDRAVDALENTLKFNPNTSLRPLLATYLAILNGSQIDPTPPIDRIPVTGDMFAPEDPQEESPVSDPAASSTDQ